MKITCTPWELQLKHAFNVSYARTPSGAQLARSIVFVRLERNGVAGFGEASPSRRYEETAETVLRFITSLDAESLSPLTGVDFLDAIGAHAPANTAAKCALDLAWHDWHCRSNGVSLAEYLEHTALPPGNATVSSFTIGIDELEVIGQKIHEAEEYPVLKIKLGSNDDERIMRTVRNATNKPLRIDANEGWRSREEALNNIRWLSELNVECIEQPLPAALDGEMPWLKERSPLPLIADESCRDTAHVERCAAGFHGVNVKLMKTGGIRGAIAMFRRARALGLKIMIGCFVESSLAVTAAAHFARYADYADLDGAALCTNDPFNGATIVNGTIVLPAGSGIGGEWRAIPTNL